MSKIKTIEENKTTEESTKLASFPYELFHNISEFSDAKSLVNLSLTNKAINKTLNEKRFDDNSKSIRDRKIESLIQENEDITNDFIKNQGLNNVTLYTLTEENCRKFKDYGYGYTPVTPSKKPLHKIYLNLLHLYSSKKDLKKMEIIKKQFYTLINNSHGGWHNLPKLKIEKKAKAIFDAVQKKLYTLTKKEIQQIIEENTLRQKIDCLKEILDKKLSVKKGVSFKPIIREIKNEEELNSFLSDKNKFFGLYERLDWLNNKEQYEAFKDLGVPNKERDVLFGGKAFKELQRKIYNKCKTPKPLFAYF